MTEHSTNRTSSIFESGRVRPGIYKIQNLASETYLDIHRQSKQLCCRPAQDLEEGRGLWEIKNLGPGYTVQVVDSGHIKQFCTPMNGTNDAVTISVNAYPVAWRIEAVSHSIYRGFSFYWGPTGRTWDLDGGCNDNGRKVHFYDERGIPCQMWKLIPISARGIPTPAQHSGELESDDFDTVVTEVTTVTTTTRRRYRVTEA